MNNALQGIRSLCYQVLKNAGFFPTYHIVEDVRDEVKMVVDGVERVSFASNSYLSIGTHPKVLEAMRNATHFGLGSGGSRITAGSHSMHCRLEERIARYKGTEDAILFSTGYLVNTGVIVALATPPLRMLVSRLSGQTGMFKRVEMLFDALVHASIIDGIRQACGTDTLVVATRYKHRDVRDLERRLQRSECPIKLILTDGLFSLHGRIAPLKEILDLAEKYDSAVYVDDAHATAVIGPHGKGTADYFGVEGRVDYNIGTLSKAIGGQGGYLAGSSELCEEFRVQCRSHVYQTSMPVVIAAGLIAALDVIDEEPFRRQRVNETSANIRSELVRLGFDILGSETQIIPVCFCGEKQAKAAAEYLLSRGIFAPAYFAPAVPPGEDMVRINVCYAHTDMHVDQLLNALEEAGQKFGVI